MSGSRKKYTPEFREQAVRLVVDTGRPIAHVAAEIGVGEQLLGRWVAAAKARSATDNPEVLDDDERAEARQGLDIGRHLSGQADEGWLYLCAVRDGCSRRVLGWAVEDHMRTNLVESALSMAITVRSVLPDQVIFHADRGTQYTSGRLARFADRHGIAQSVGRTGVCWDNAQAESFWSTMKSEFYNRYTWPTKKAARLAVGDWIERVYNRRRPHSKLGMISPVEFENRHTQTAQAA